ncbi:MAG: NAD-dependent epimerase/dehydratase family protein [Vicinamibacterales bacterium]
MRILVTGGTGYLGRAIVQAAAARGHAVVVLARRASSAGLPGEAVDADVRDRAAVVAAARGVDAICHTAALVSLWRPDPREFDAVNVGGLEHAIAAAREAGVARLVYTSSFLALPPAGRETPIAANDYQRTKAAARQVALRARDAGLPILLTYPGVVYGPGVRTDGNLVGRLLADHAARRLPGLVGPERVWSFSWIDDVALAHVVAIERGAVGADYPLGGENAPVMRAFELARDLGLRGLPRRLPYAIAAVTGAIEEWRARLTGATPLVTRATVEIFRHDWPVEHARAAADLGYRPTPLAEGLRRTVAELLPGRNTTT